MRDWRRCHLVRDILERLVHNSHLAISDGIYDIDESLDSSESSFVSAINTSQCTPVITEIKFASPSLGKISTLTNPVLVAQQMIAGGAIGLSVLTQPHLFSGSPRYFTMIRDAVKVPMLMKDIIVDKIQLDAAVKIGADMILLIQSLFDRAYVSEIDEFIDYAHKSGLEVLLEVHTRQEFDNAANTAADIIGINNRDLDTLEIDLDTTCKILKDNGTSRLIISESGIESSEQIRELKRCGAGAFLIGTSIMRHGNIEAQVKRLVESY